MKYLWLLLFLPALASAQTKTASCTAEVEIRDVIGPATSDLVKRTQAFAARENCSSILLEINTPGGSLETTRTLVEMIMNSPIPYLCLVAPSGGHAGSAGAILLQACHVNGALHGTNLGAATPVALGQDLPKDLRRKIMNDTRSWVEGMTELRGRNSKFGEDIILNAKAVTAEEAFKLGAVDFLGDDTAQFLKFAQGRQVKMNGGGSAAVEVGTLKNFPLDTRYTVLSLLTDPEFAYMLLLGSLALLYFEFTHPGAVAPGVAGAIGLVVSMIALNKLEVEWAGLLLIFLGMGMMIAELFLPTFGAIGFGGIAAIALGSVFLFDPVKSGYRLPWTLIAPVVVVFAAVFVTLTVLVYRTRRVKKKGGFEDLIGQTGTVRRLDGDTGGMIELQGEIWKFEAGDKLALNDRVTVTGARGLILQVKRSST